MILVLSLYRFFPGSSSSAFPLFFSLHPVLPPTHYCKWKEKVAAFGTNTCRFLAHIVRKVALSITEPEAILAVIPNEEEILATILRNMVPCLHPIGTYQ
jgi:hypothetical protein